MNGARTTGVIGSKELIREMNLSTVLDSIRRMGAMSRADLASRSGLSKASVTSLTKELLDAGLLVSTGVAAPGAIGRPGELLDLEPSAGSFLSIEVGVDFLAAMLTDLKAQPLWRVRRTGAPAASEAIAWLDGMLDTADEEVASRSLALLGVSVGLPGLVEVKSGTLAFAPNLGWHEVRIREHIAARYQVPVFVDNEARLAGIGEAYFGAATRHEDVLYIHVSSGVAGTLLSRDTPYAGHRGFAGQYGHMTIDPNGPTCNCGNRGCWEMLVGERAILAELERLRPGAGDQPGAIEQLVSNAVAGDADAATVLGSVAEYLGIGIANLVNAFDPSMVVIGGTLSTLVEALIGDIHEIVKARALSHITDGLEVVCATHGADAALYGGIAIACQHALRNPTGRVLAVARPRTGSRGPDVRVADPVGAGPRSSVG